MHVDPSNPAMSSTIVCMTEVTKLFFSLFLAISIDCKGSVLLFLHHLEKAFVEDAADLLKVSTRYFILMGLLLQVVGIWLDAEWFIAKLWSCSLIHPTLSTIIYDHHTNLQ